MFNTSLIRRRVRDAGLRLEAVNAETIRTDIVIAYIEDLALKVVDQVQAKAQRVDTDSLPIGSKAWEYLAGVSLNPLPKVRFQNGPMWWRPICTKDT